jgi:hypothetical protein
MNFDEALRRYRKGQFTDHDVTRCTDLSVRGWRELIKNRAVRTVTENRGRGRIRLCDATVFKRAAVIAVLNRAGFSLAVAGHIAYALPLHTLLYEICDPWAVLLQRSAGVDPETGLPPRVEQPKADWFDPDKPAKAEPESDWLLEIYDGRFVGVTYNVEEEPTIFGDLREDGTSFVAWFPFRRRSHWTGGVVGAIAQELAPSIVDSVTAWEDPTLWGAQLKLLDYKYEKHDRADDPLCIAAESAAHSPVVKTTINVTLAVRKALRRYLDIEPAEPLSKSESRHESSRQ